MAAVPPIADPSPHAPGRAAGHRVVSWRRAAATIAAVTLGATAVVVVTRSDGLPAVDATAGRATRWFVDQAAGRIVLVDGYAGRALVRLDAAAAGAPLDVAEGASAAYLLDPSGAQVREIDTAGLRLGAEVAVAPLAAPAAVTGVGRNGLVVADPATAEAAALTLDGTVVPFALGGGATGDVGSGGAATALVAPDGAVWTLDGTAVRRTSLNRSTVTQIDTTGGGPPVLTLVGNAAFVVDRVGARSRFVDGDWVRLPADVDGVSLAVQVPGPAGSCGWVAAGDRMWCVGRSGIERSVTVAGLDAGLTDVLAVGGDAAALVRRGPPAIVRFDPSSGRLLDDVTASIAPTASVRVVATTDLVWVDDVGGSLVWAVNPWGLRAVRKDDASVPLLGETGDVVDGGSSSGGGPGAEIVPDLPEEERVPDDDGIDDPPVAVDDVVTARAGPPVAIAVTANDWDPDGDAIAVVRVGAARNGAVDIVSASTVVYRPEPGFVGEDRFEYTIADGGGNEATATVFVELLPPDGLNRPPVAVDDTASTAADVAVVVDVLTNDVDPERDPLSIASFTPADVGGEVTETVGPSGLPALRYAPPSGVSGRATFTYRPVDALGAVGEPATVRVDIAQPGDENRPPRVRPDAVRVRRNLPATVPVLANDVDPDGDVLTVSVVQPVPAGLDVDVRGDELVVTARAGAAELTRFWYEVDDGNGHRVQGQVLVVVVADAEPNRPPLVNPDAATAVVGVPRLIDVLANDVDPDGDPLTIVSVTQPPDGGGRTAVRGDRVEFVASPLRDDDDEAVTVRFSYAVSDGNGHEVTGDVTVRVLAEPVAAPPFARDDAATTERDVPVTLDVLRNDGDPSGERPSLVGTPSCPAGGDAAVTSDQQVRFTPPRGQVGVFRCTYEVTNTQGLRASARIVVTVREPAVSNLAPVVADERRTVEVGTSVVVDLLANASDPDGDDAALTVLSSSSPVLGTARRDGRLLRFTADDQTGVATITFQVGDPDGGVATARLVIRVVEPEPVPPVAVPDARTVFAPTDPVVIDVVANDLEGSTPGLRVRSVTRTAGDGTVALTGGALGRSVVMTPSPGFVGDLVGVYELVDGGGLTATATVTLTVLPPLNRPPVAVDDAAEVVNGGSVTVAVLANDVEPDGDPLTVSIVAGPDPALGSARLDADRTITFVAAPGASGTASIVYRISDGELTDDATLRVRVLPCTEATPGAPDLFLRTGYQQPIAVDLTPVAVNGQIVDVGPPLLAPAGVITPPPGENGEIVFTYAVVNGCRLRATGTVTIDVNQPPVAQPYTVALGRDEQRVVPVSDLASDAEPLRISQLEGAPTWATVVESGAALRLAPAGAGPGVFGFRAVVADPGGLSTSVRVTVELVNRAPIARPDAVDASGGAVVVSLLDNDSDPDGDAIRIQSIPETFPFSSPPGALGTIQVLDERRVRIDPGTGVGSATFEYRIVDVAGAVSAPATVTVRVNRPPTAADAAVDVPEGTTVTVVLPASDPDGDALVLTVDGVHPSLDVSVVTGGLSITAGRRGPPTTSFTYTVTDPYGASASAIVTVTVTDPPPTTTTTTAPTTTAPTTTAPTTTATGTATTIPPATTTTGP